MPRQTTPTTREPLQWLFKAEFPDGHMIEQDLDDTCHSRTDGTGSAFSDVLAYGKPKGFTLCHVDGKQYAYVDLLSGNFVVNGTPIAIHNQNFEPQKYELELVYFRETRVEQTVNREAEIVGTRHFVNRYFIGWQTQVNGKNKQVTLAVG
jgi:hypothetical protein